MILFMLVRTPRVFWQGISGSVEFTSFRKTRRNSRDGLASPVIMCECAMELAQLREGSAAAQPQPLHAQPGRRIGAFTARW